MKFPCLDWKVST